METMLKLSEKRSDRKSKVKSEPTNVKKKRDWVAIVHKGVYACSEHLRAFLPFWV